eukprot:976860_1
MPAVRSTVGAARSTVSAAPSDLLSQVDRNEPRCRKLEKRTKIDLRERLRKHIQGNPKRVEWMLDSLCSTHTREELLVLVMSRPARIRKVTALEPIWKKNRRAARWNLRVSIRKLIQGDKDWVDRVCNLIFGRTNNDEITTLLKSPSMQKIKIRNAEECLRNRDANYLKRKSSRKSTSPGKGKTAESGSKKSGSAPSESKAADAEPSGSVETELPVLPTNERICLCGVRITKAWRPVALKDHENGRRHKSAVARRLKFGGCDVCHVQFSSREHETTHMRSEKHADNSVKCSQKSTAQSSQQEDTSQPTHPTVHSSNAPCGETVSKTVSCTSYVMNFVNRVYILRKLRRTFRSLTIRFTSPNSILVGGFESDVENSLGEVKRLMETEERVVAKYVKIGSAREIMTTSTKDSILCKLSSWFPFVKFKYIECTHSFKAIGFETDVDNCIGGIERLVGTTADSKAQQKTASKPTLPTVPPAKSAAPCGKTDMNAQQKTASTSTRPVVPPSKSAVPCGKTVTKSVSFKDIGQYMNIFKKNSMLQQLRSAFRMVKLCYVDQTHCFIASGLESHVDECLEEVE